MCKNSGLKGQHVWIGMWNPARLKIKGAKPGWQWTDGRPYNYKHWEHQFGVQMPDNRGGIQHCTRLQMDYHNGWWDDIQCMSDFRAGVCELLR